MSILAPQSPDAAIIAEMTWVLLIGGAVVFLVVLAAAACALLAPRERAARLASPAFVAYGGIVFPAVVLTALLVYSLARAASLSSPGADAALRIEVVGEQWWWRVRYLDASGREDFVTANEIHIPAGQPVDLTLVSADVIHSFWVPELGGKLDMIPGKRNRMRIAASAPGSYRGQCAEYCGGPHGLMAFLVVAQAPEAFDAWAARQRSQARAPNNTRGASLFVEACGACHSVRGTPARGTRGPDLTHVAGRSTLGAGLLPLDARTLEQFIADGQRLKPGNLMPSFAHLPPEERAAIAAWLADLE